MSTVSPVPGSATSGSFPHSSQQQQQQHTSTPNHHHSSQHHPSSQDDAASGMAHTSFDSVASHHSHQSHHHQQPPQQQQQQQQQQSHQQPPPHSSHASSNGHPWGAHPHQVQHYGSNGYPSHTMYSSSAGYYSNHSNGSANFGNGYAAYSVQPHQGPAQQSMYGSHGPSSTTMNGSAHHSGSSTPNSTTPYAHHPHPSMGQQGGGGGGGGGSLFSAQPYHPHHQSSGGYYPGPASNSMISSPSYSSGPQYGTQLPLSGRHRVTTTLWEDEGTLCFQVDARGVCVARRHDNNMINGTKLLNVCGMSRGKRDGILKNEKERIVVKVGAMHLKGVWITFLRGRTLAEQNDILDVLYPLFETNIQSFLYHPDNYPRTAAVMAAAQERNSQRSRISGGTNSPGHPYPPPQQRASSHSAGPVSGSTQQHNPPPLMRANTTPGGPLVTNSSGSGNASAASTYQHQQSNGGYSSAPNHSQQHSPYAPSHAVSTRSEREDVAVKSEVPDTTATAAAANARAQQYYGEDIKPLSESAQLNSSSPYAFPATNVPLKNHNTNSLLHNRSEQGDEVGMVNLPWSTTTAYRSNNGYSRH